ncbi:MAG: 5-(carboxyamino)imidazole ribonucleotide synthase, partial [Proteobacteria bacterium]|nr:5-(carboxyamino)imidazole ribonucleotide synthase [Pseudomonadota bacterium]
MTTDVPRPPPLGPGATIGVLGGGQLGRMMAIVARQMGYRIVVLDPNPRCPTAQLADGFVVGALDDIVSGRHLAKQVDVITLDTEHVPGDILAELETIVPVRPGASVLRIIQDRLVQKQFLDRIGVAQARWAPAGDVDELRAALALLGKPAILKLRRAGYDGKGQARIPETSDGLAEFAHLTLARPAVLPDQPAEPGNPAVLEELVRFTREISVILARDLGGEIRIYPIAENVHRRHILHTTRAPAPMTLDLQTRAEAIAVKVATSLGHVGVMAVEMFELPDGTLLVNEVAPRVHNSGHYTLGACATSQFEQHVRAVCGLPLGDQRALTGAVMVNLIGDLWAGGPPRWAEVLARPEAK